MTWITPRAPSLLATANTFPVEWWLVYTDTDRPYWWNPLLDPKFRHVAAYRRDGQVWLAYIPSAEFLDVQVLRTDAEPWPAGAITQRVVALRREGGVRSRLFVGPITCVEHMKALLGIRAWFLRTPLQLYRYCRRHL